jgi:C-terminal processing protease CtpA/Prc
MLAGDCKYAEMLLTICRPAGMKLAVLVNKASASASEIVAGIRI